MQTTGLVPEPETGAGAAAWAAADAWAAGQAPGSAGPPATTPASPPAVQEAGRRQRSLLDDPEPVQPPAAPRRRSAALSLGFLVAVLALVGALVLVVAVVNSTGNSAPPNPSVVSPGP